MYKKIIVPLDGSELAECTLSHVKNLFKDGSVGEVTLLNVFKFDLPWALMESEHHIQHIDINAIREPFLVRSRKYLADIESRLVSEGMKVKTESLEANRPADAITEYAQEKRYGYDHHWDPRLYRTEKADVGQRGIQCSPSIPYSSAPY